MVVIAHLYHPYLHAECSTVVIHSQWSSIENGSEESESECRCLNRTRQNINLVVLKATVTGPVFLKATAHMNRTNTWRIHDPHAVSNLVPWLEFYIEGGEENVKLSEMYEQ